MTEPLPVGCSAGHALELLSPAEAPAVFDLYARCADYFLLQDGEVATRSDADELFTDVPPGRSPEHQHVLGLRAGGRLDAVAALLADYPQAGEWYLGLLLIVPERRGQGLGRELYASIEHWSMRQGATRMLLAVLEENASAYRFWRSLGFRTVRKVDAASFKQKVHRRYELARPLTRIG